MKKIIKEIIPYILILIIVVIIRSYIITPITVVGSSMYPNLKDGELLLLSKISYKLNDIDRFDVVVIKSDDWVIKRVIGLPGENVMYIDNELYINDKKVKDSYPYGDTDDFDLESVCLKGDLICKNNVIPKGYYLVLGDNRGISKDSRSVGLISEEEIKGRAIVRFWPLKRISLVK